MINLPFCPWCINNNWLGNLSNSSWSSSFFDIVASFKVSFSHARSLFKDLQKIISLLKKNYKNSLYYHIETWLSSLDATNTDESFGFHSSD